MCFVLNSFLAVALSAESLQVRPHEESGIGVTMLSARSDLSNSYTSRDDMVYDLRQTPAASSACRLLADHYLA
jgi:hypothetical protein